MTFCSVRTALQNNCRSYLNSSTSALSSMSRSKGTRRVRNLKPLQTLSLRRSLSTTTTTTTTDPSSQQQQKQKERLIPIQHSSKGPPPVCRDVVELQELTQQLLETPVGSLFCQTTSMPKVSSPSDDRDEAYDTARESGELVEYLLRGYNRTISPLTLCGGNVNDDSAKDLDPEQTSVSLEAMMDVMERFNQEGEMYLRLRREAINYNNPNSNITNDGSSSSSSSSSDSDSDSDDDSADGNQPIDDPRFSSAVQDKLKVDAREQKQQKLDRGTGDDDFAVPGVTTAMYDTILDAMACAAEQQNNNSTSTESSYLQLLEPDDLYQVAGAAWKAHDLNNQHNNNIDLFFPSTIPTMVTYNATLRGIGNLCMATASNENDDELNGLVVDQGLSYGFGVYNHLTHNDHGLPKRNSASIIYLLQIIKACIPPSRSRGNMTVALWHQASMEGLVTPELIQTVHELHSSGDGDTNCNGPEFDIFLESLEKCAGENPNENSSKVIITPQRFARFAKKYSHSKFY